MTDSQNEITPKEFYEAISKMETRLVKRLDAGNDQVTNMRVQLAEVLTQMKDHDKEIGELRKRSNLFDILLAFFTVIGATIAAYFKSVVK